MTILVAVLAVTALSALAVGCGSDDDGGSGTPTTAGAEAGKQFAPEPEKGIHGGLLPAERELWTYDRATGKYKVVDGDASSFEPKLTEPDQPLTIGYMDPWAANPFAVPIRKDFQRRAKELGIEVPYCDVANKPEHAISCAELLTRQSPDFVVAGNWQTGASEAMMKIFDDARVPTAQIDVWAPNSIFFGADNYTSGEQAGKAAGEYAKQKWDCDDLWVFLGEDKTAGEAPALRLSGFVDGVREVCGELPEDRIGSEIMAGGTGDQALTVTTDWLTAHPQAERIVATTLDDERSSGVAKAFTASDRDAVVLGQGCDAVGVEVVKQESVDENHYLGCVAFFPDRYAQYLLAIALDVVAEKPVPNEVHLKHEFLTHETIDRFYK